MKPAPLLALLLSSFAAIPADGAPASPLPDAAAQKIEDRLDATIIEKFKVDHVPLKDVIALIQKDAQQMNPLFAAESRLQNPPVPIVLDLAKPSATRITLNLSDFSESQLLMYVSIIAGLQISVTSDGVRLSDKPIKAASSLLVREYLFFYDSPDGDAGWRTMLESEGVTFPEGSFLHYDRASKTLILRNTDKNLALMARLPANPQTKKYKAQLEKTMIPSFKVSRISLPDAVALIKKKAREADPKSEPVPIFIDPDFLRPAALVPPPPPEDAPGPLPASLTLSLSNISELDLLYFVTRSSGATTCGVNPYGYTIAGCQVDANDALHLRQYRITARAAKSFSPDDAKCTDFLRYRGVPCSFAHYDPAGQILTICVGDDQQELTQEILTALSKPNRVAK